MFANRRQLLHAKYVDTTKCLEYADSYFDRKRNEREAKKSGDTEYVCFVSKRKKEFVSIIVTDVQGSKWESHFDEISECVLWRNGSSGMSTYKRPESTDEVWMREQLIRDQTENENRIKEASMWYVYLKNMCFFSSFKIIYNQLCALVLSVVLA